MPSLVVKSDEKLYCPAISEANPGKYGLNGNAPTHITRQGMLNGDVSGNDGITNLDALTIQKFMLELITKLPE
ncbi:MAG: hypothetical protein MJ100_02515 [Ruminococcus sp.]|nr:hypothetical protein [Ruminococcus sp.]